MFNKFLQEQAALHPASAPQDLIKLCYQAAFGCEHLIEDLDEAKKNLAEEWDKTEPAGPDMPLLEWISPDFARLNLAAAKRDGLPLEWLQNLFVHSRGDDLSGSEHALVLFKNYLDVVRSVSRDHLFSFTEDEWIEEIRSYLADGVYPVRHSQAYRTAEKPAYRLLDKNSASVLPVLLAVKNLPAGEGDAVRVIAIDGRAASGKTSLASYLAEFFGAEVIHTDDFFLPEELRTEERFAIPGFNMHFERFFREVMPHLHEKEGFSYKSFDCSKMAPGDERTIKEGSCRIVEGAYSMHPLLGDYADLKIFMDIDEKLQKKRIAERDGAAAPDYEERWIPLEEKYIAYYALSEKADLVLKAKDRAQ